jgi:hypothetical protein
MHRSFAAVRAILAATVTAISSAYAKAQQFFLAVAAGPLLMSMIAAPATAAPLVSWRIIHGVVATAENAHGLTGAGDQWTTIVGSATVDMGAGTLQFTVTGLTLAQGDDIGTTGSVTSVLGAISCSTGQASFQIELTQAVPLSPQGDASSGTLPIVVPAICTPSNIAFFITAVVSGSNIPPYMAFGASRFTH